MALLDYQQDAYRSLKNHLREEHRALIVMATGLGKTWLVAHYVCDELIMHGRGLVLCHDTNILEQNLRVFREHLGEKVSLGVFNGYEKEFDAVNILFATFQTFREWKIVHFKNEFHFIIVDEAHHGEANTFKPVIEYFEPKVLIGMTATPDRMDDRDICALFGDAVVEMSLEEGIAKGWLTPVEYHLLSDHINGRILNKMLKEIREGGERVSVKQLNQILFIERRDDEIARIILEHGNHGLVFCTNVLHADTFVKFLPNAATLHSKNTTEENDRALREFKEGTLQFLVAVDMLNEGIDIPRVGLVVFLRPTDSKTIFFQQLGRGLRRMKGKEKVTVLDFAGNCDRVAIVQQLVDHIRDFSEQGLAEYDHGPFFMKGDGFEFVFDETMIELMDLLQRMKTKLYSTVKEAMESVIKLKISSADSYKVRYKEDPRLPSNPNNTFRDDWNRIGKWPGFLGKPLKNFYPTVEEAMKAVKKLKISSSDYHTRYREDPRLPSSPQKIYEKDWDRIGRWTGFMGRQQKDPYTTIEEATESVVRLKILSREDYQARYKEDSRLPSNPSNVYSSDWKNIGEWSGFLGKPVKNFYSSVEEAMEAAIRLEIFSSEDYKRLHKEDPRLHSNPNILYKTDWNRIGKWPGFFGRPKDFYSTVEEAMEAVVKLKILRRESIKGYFSRYKEDPRLPSSPHYFYKKDWSRIGGWPGFLGRPKDFYPTVDEVMNALKKLKIHNSKGYQSRYKEDPRLPSNPNEVYKDDWDRIGGWAGLFGRTKKNIYHSIEEAMEATAKLQISSVEDYIKHYKEDPRLPAKPEAKYPSDWERIGRWAGFLEKIKK